MKKLVFIFGIMMCIIACTSNSTNNTQVSADSTTVDSANVDSVIVDSIIVDSINK